MRGAAVANRRPALEHGAPPAPALRGRLRFSPRVPTDPRLGTAAGGTTVRGRRHGRAVRPDARQRVPAPEGGRLAPGPRPFGRTVVSLSLLSACVMDFRH